MCFDMHHPEIGGMAERHIAEPIKNMAIPANATPFEVVSSDDEYEEDHESEYYDE